MNYALIGIALVPTIVIFSVVLKKTPTIKKEPFKRVAKVFIVSALSTIIAAILEYIGIIILAISYNSDANKILSMSGLFALCVFIIGPAEELCKYFTFKLTIFKNRDFDHTYDGIVYGAAAALGFATLENIFYVLGNGSKSGALMGAFTGILRAALSVPLHAFTGIFMGYYFGLSKYKKYNNIESDKNPQRRAFFISVLVHGLYDFLALASVAKDAPESFEYVGIAGVIGIMIIVYMLMYKIITKASKEDLMIYNEYYYQHLNGHFQDMVGKTNENGTVLVNPDNVQNFVTNAYGSQPNTMAGQPVVWQYGSIPNNTTDQQSGGYPYGNSQNAQFGYQPHNTQQPNNVNPYSQGQYGGYPASNAYQSQNTVAYDQNYEPVRQTYTPSQIQPQPGETVKFCNECGNKLTSDTKFCPICGHKI
ncbi:PrsW family glutamic-type intramembrane protease [Ruminococcus albus]|uniref:Membrane proteinase PrsW, cleaves anti-sigma factor RsiW, M82 family n=1 Tax=Ruminococcus albus TaxID=1264 RepID=A0A1H7FF76_RUMAL|nr:PrsW family glutamic-type intramembrane protease [Ruminococcus albus]SEK23072.1 Membrane proteinase PrsW, cleaves anti-sigma factor RsiW, M82 family [Ruminococcus albus]